ncbi:MAG: exopolysaccharide biosynthesis polyprenyl glycosylphosphotransferase [Verrucomicrobiota bacterium]
MSHFIIQVHMLVLFSLLLVASAYGILNVAFGYINFPLYYLGIFIAGILSFPPQQNNHESELTSFRWVRGIRQANYQTIVLILVLFSIVVTTKDKAISRLFITSFLFTFWVTAIPINRYAAELIAKFAFRGHNSVRTIFLGSAKSAHHLEDWTRRQPFFGIEIIGLVTYEMAMDSNLRMKIIGEFMDLEKIMDEYKVDQVILLETRDSDWWVDTVVELCEKKGRRILIFNPWEEYFDKVLIPVHQAGHTFFTLQQEPLENPINRYTKRALDIAVSLPVVVFVLPLMCLLVKFMHKKQSPGPMFFKQKRSGQRGRDFMIYKFRSMHHFGDDRSRESEQAKKEDSRVFAFGQFMRKTSLDEFPQFLNVLRGTMSVVGPRPHLIQHDDVFSEQVNIYRTRNFVKPGITGLAQCKGYRGEITEVALIEERVRYDLEYIKGWSFWLDLWILFKTGIQVIKPPKTAY